MMVKLRNYWKKTNLFIILQRRNHFYGERSLGKGYVPDEVESEIRSYWEQFSKHPLSRDNVIENDSVVKYSMVLPPPNVTGTLHLGHALTTTLQDVLAKRKRMERMDVVWVPGLDHAGIATQAIVEQVLTNHGLDPKSMSRQQLLEHIQSWKSDKSVVILNQLNKLAPSLDWSRQFFTLDQGQRSAVNEAFRRLYKSDLIYRCEKLVNWSVKLGSALSDMEVNYKQIKGPTEFHPPSYDQPVVYGQMIDVAFKVHGLSDKEIVVSTCRLETMPGDKAVAVHPDDDRYKQFHNKLLIHPLTNKQIPIILDNSVQPAFGTGAVKVTPAHDQTDFDMAKRHNLEIINVIDENGLLNSNAAELSGLNRFKARSTVLSLLSDKGCIRQIRDHEMSVPVCSRTGDIIELVCKPQWFLKCKEMGSRALESVEKGDLEIIPDQYIKIWTSYLENIRDWCISRQVIWGHKMPLYTDGNEKFILQEHGVAMDKSFFQVPDVLDTWFSSALLPFSVFGWPQKNKDLDVYFPLDIMVTGHDILFFWVARMVMLSLQLTDKLPFKKVLLHSVICDPQGRKMSKSLGNVIDPQHIINGISYQELLDDVKDRVQSGSLKKDEADKAKLNIKQLYSNGIQECGTDALRLTLLSHRIKNHYIHFDTEICYVNKLFCNKLWQACRFTMDWSEKLLPQWKLQSNLNFKFDKSPVPQTKLDSWLLANLMTLFDTVDESINSFDFHVAVNEIKEFVQHNFCDIYLEAVKPTLKSSNQELASNTCYILLYTLVNSVQLLAPLTPFLSEKLYQHLYPHSKKSVHLTHCPSKIKISLPSNMQEIKEEVNLCLNIVKEIRRLKLTQKQTKTDSMTVGLYLSDRVFSTDLLELIETLCRNKFLVLTEVKESKWVLFSCLNDKTSIYYSSQLQKSGKQSKDSDIDKKKLVKLEKELEKLMSMTSHESYKTKVSQAVQKNHQDKILKLKVEIEQLKQVL